MLWSYTAAGDLL